MALPLHRAAQGGGTVLLQGPRGAGKTTLLRREFPGHTYFALDRPQDRTPARQDPAAFLGRLRGPAIVDDLHRAPELIRYLAETGGDWPLLLGASRCVRLPVPTLTLYHPTASERGRRAPLALSMLGRFVPAAATAASLPEAPEPVHYRETDIYELVKLHDMDRFERFFDAARGRSGLPLDIQALARECDVAHRTAVRWLAAMEDCFLTLKVPASELDCGRRLIRAPKLHFLDSPVWESRVVSELYRNAMHTGETPDFRHWRDSNGLEIPLLVESPLAPAVPVAIAENPNPETLDRLRRWMGLAGVPQGAIIARNLQTRSRTGGVLRYGFAQL